MNATKLHTGGLPLCRKRGESCRRRNTKDIDTLCAELRQQENSETAQEVILSRRVCRGLSHGPERSGVVQSVRCGAKP